MDNHYNGIDRLIQATTGMAGIITLSITLNSSRFENYGTIYFPKPKTEAILCEDTNKSAQYRPKLRTNNYF